MNDSTSDKEKWGTSGDESDRGGAGATSGRVSVCLGHENFFGAEAVGQPWWGSLVFLWMKRRMEWAPKSWRKPSAPPNADTASDKATPVPLLDLHKMEVNETQLHQRK